MVCVSDPESPQKEEYYSQKLTDLEIATILGFIVLGLLLIVLEVVFVPGTTFVGLGGAVLSIYGIYLSFEQWGNTGGFITILVTAVVAGVALYYSFTTKSWQKFSLKKSMSGKFNDEISLDLEVGDIGEALSTLKPVGKALFSDKEWEVRSNGEYIDAQNKVVISKIQGTIIYVEKA